MRPGLRHAGLCLLLLLAAPAHAAGIERVQQTLEVALDPSTRALTASSDITFEGGGVVDLTLATRFAIASLQLDGRTIDTSPAREGALQRWRITPAGAGAHRLSVRYHGTLARLPEIDHRGTLTALPPMADPRGSYLPGGTGWYPQLGEQSFRYRVRLDLPPGQRGLVPGTQVAETADAQGYRAEYDYPHPADSIELMAGPYTVTERRLTRPDGAPIRLRTWFHPEIASLAAGYLDDVERYIRLYSDWIGAYPFADFSVVSSPLPTGFGMPTLTYLGIDVLRLPFIRATSLGHEVLHNWWGNGVYVDYAQGNWCEGLTTFMADYFYREQDSPQAAREARLQWLRDFAAVPAGEDFPLRHFTARTHGTSQIVGYHKSAFVFLMLRDLIGAPAFDAGLRHFYVQQKFRHASWDDLRASFETASGRNLSTFFEQWLERTGAPHLQIEAARARPAAGHVRAEVVVRQDSPAYALRVPLRLQTEDSHSLEIIALDSTRVAARLDLLQQPSTVTLDPDLRVFRQLAPGEAPPILRQVMLDPSTALVVAPDESAVRDAAQQLAARMLDAPPQPNAGGGPLLVIGLERDIPTLLKEQSLGDVPAEVAGKGSARVWAARRRGGSPAVIVSARDAEALRALARPLPHYGAQSWLVFEGSKAIARGIWPGEAVTVPFTN